MFVSLVRLGGKEGNTQMHKTMVIIWLVMAGEREGGIVKGGMKELLWAAGCGGCNGGAGRVQRWGLKSEAAGGSLTDCARPANKWEAMISLRLSNPSSGQGIHSVWLSPQMVQVGGGEAAHCGARR